MGFKQANTNHANVLLYNNDTDINKTNNINNDKFDESPRKSLATCKLPKIMRATKPLDVSKIYHRSPLSPRNKDVFYSPSPNNQKIADENTKRDSL
jgi:hypothetical protein